MWYHSLTSIHYFQCIVVACYSSSLSFRPFHQSGRMFVHLPSFCEGTLTFLYLFSVVYSVPSLIFSSLRSKTSWMGLALRFTFWAASVCHSMEIYGSYNCFFFLVAHMRRWATNGAAQRIYCIPRDTFGDCHFAHRQISMFWHSWDTWVSSKPKPRIINGCLYDRRGHNAGL